MGRDHDEILYRDVRSVLESIAPDHLEIIEALPERIVCDLVKTAIEHGRQM